LLYQRIEQEREPNRINVRNDPLASSSNQGKRHEEDEPGHDVQAGQSRTEDMAAAEWPRAPGPLAVPNQILIALFPKLTL
jgi:hypothetical protein